MNIDSKFTNLDQLPAAAQKRVFKNLNPKELATAACVSPAWHRAAGANDLWTDRYENHRWVSNSPSQSRTGQSSAERFGNRVQAERQELHSLQTQIKKLKRIIRLDNARWSVGASAPFGGMNAECVPQPYRYNAHPELYRLQERASKLEASLKAIAPESEQKSMFAGIRRFFCMKS